MVVLRWRTHIVIAFSFDFPQIHFIVDLHDLKMTNERQTGAWLIAWNVRRAKIILYMADRQALWISKDKSLVGQHDRSQNQYKFRINI